ncbi:TetR/AcrR family transcriptional regulator [Brevundimonas lenta]|uniref:AcrR family transcriptional regulator n=1 Tax=Brevundimonas lenta TaxID=424796 RepID=A0A7W6NQ06_9CAUL|nr:TetR/AcrR family transcriptional regulator [Brevundimonas lenta]MBB4083403.1 AcrR family transcriptional regulator [Brevundimonas lenta]
MVQSLTRERPVQRVAKGEQTRDRIMDIAEASVLEKGFAATSIDEILFEACITKSGFFYHFRDKNDLALALIERFRERNLSIFEENFARADELVEDPLQAFLLGLKLLAEIMAEVQTERPGCLVSTFVFQDQQFDGRVRQMLVDVIQVWCAQFLARLERVAEVHPPRVDIPLADLADMLMTVIDGGIIVSKALQEPQIMARQILAYRTFVRTVFLGT